MKPNLFCVLLASVATVPAHAQGSDPDIVVTANRDARPADEVSQSVTVIGETEIRDRQSTNVTDLLRTVPGVTVTRAGPIGSVVGVNIRGAENDQNVVLIDGVKLNDPAGTGGGFNFGNLLVGNVRRIEVVRGSQSVLWGSQAIGGVVNLITAAPTTGWRVDARGEYGWRDTAQIVGNVSGRAGPVALSAGAGWFRSDGFSAFANGTERDRYEQFGANAKLLVDVTDTLSIDLRGYFADSRVGIDGFPAPAFAFADSPDRQDTTELVGYAGVNFAALDGRFRNRIGFAYTRVERENFEPASVPQVTFAGTGENERFEYQGVLDLGIVTAVFGAEHERSRFATTSFGGPVARARAELTSFYAQATLRPVKGVALTGGVRRDDHDRFGGATTFAASGTLSPNGGRTIFRASYGEGFKVPSLFQLYSIYGNTALRPERARSWDAGVTQRMLGDAVEIGATFFHRDTTDQIDFVFCPAGATAGPCVARPFGVYDNVRRTRAEGVELTLDIRPTERLQVRGSYSFIDARDRGTGNRLARRPSETASVIVDWHTPFGLRLGGTAALVGDSFDNAANSVRLDGYVLADVRASFEVVRGVEVYGRVENLFDARYQTVANYGTAGRAAHAGVRLSM